MTVTQVLTEQRAHVMASYPAGEVRGVALAQIDSILAALAPLAETVRKECEVIKWVSNRPSVLPRYREDLQRCAASILAALESPAPAAATACNLVPPPETYGGSVDDPWTGRLAAPPAATSAETQSGDGVRRVLDRIDSELRREDDSAARNGSFQGGVIVNEKRRIVRRIRAALAPSAPADPQAMGAKKGDDYKHDDEDHKTFGIDVTNCWRDIRGNLREHGSMIQVYRSEALRDRVLYLLQTYGFGDASKDIGK